MSYLTNREHVYHSVVAGLAVFVLNVARDDIWPRAFADGAVVGVIVYLVPSLGRRFRKHSRHGARVYNGLLAEADPGNDPD